jgi:hypothetical protein
MRLLAALVGLLALVSLTACQPMAAGTGELVHCNVMLDPPTRDDPKTPHRIVSQVRYWCEDPGAGKLALTLRMQKQNANGDWFDVASSSFAVSGQQTVRTNDLRYQTRAISISCASGVFRTTVVGSSTGKSTKDTNYDLTGARSANPCIPALQFRKN